MGFGQPRPLPVGRRHARRITRRFAGAGAKGIGDDRKEGEAQALAGARPFADTDGHWAAGYVAVAKAMGLTVGYHGTF